MPNAPLLGANGVLVGTRGEDLTQCARIEGIWSSSPTKHLWVLLRLVLLWPLLSPPRFADPLAWGYVAISVVRGDVYTCLVATGLLSLRRESIWLVFKLY